MRLLPKEGALDRVLICLDHVWPGSVEWRGKEGTAGAYQGVVGEEGGRYLGGLAERAVSLDEGWEVGAEGCFSKKSPVCKAERERSISAGSSSWEGLIFPSLRDVCSSSEPRFDDDLTSSVPVWHLSVCSRELYRARRATSAGFGTHVGLSPRFMLSINCVRELTCTLGPRCLENSICLVSCRWESGDQSLSPSVVPFPCLVTLVPKSGEGGSAGISSGS